MSAHTITQASTTAVGRAGGLPAAGGPTAELVGILAMIFSIAFVNLAVLATMSDSLWPCELILWRARRQDDFRSFASHTVKPGTTAASVRRAYGRDRWRAGGDAEEIHKDALRRSHVGFMRMPTVSPARIAPSRPRTKSSLSTVRLPCMVR